MKTEKTATVTLLRVNHRQFQSKDLMHVHYLEFNNGDKGEYFSVSPECPEFSINELVKYTIWQRGMLGNKPTYNISPVNKAASKPNTGSQGQSNGGNEQRPQFSRNNASGKPQRNENAIMSQHAITKSIELIACKATKPVNLYPKALEILQWTQKLGSMSVEEILALPVEFIEAEIQKSKGNKKD